MAKENILTVLETALLNTFDDQYDFAMDFDSKHHRITLYFRLFAQNEQAEVIEDEDGVMASDIIEFEDAVLLYQEGQTISDDEYLYTLAFNRKKGLPYATLMALAETLRDVLDEGQSDLLDFIHDANQEEFSLHFDEATFKHYLEIMEQRYPNRWVAYPKF